MLPKNAWSHALDQTQRLGSAASANPPQKTAASARRHRAVIRGYMSTSRPAGATIGRKVRREVAGTAARKPESATPESATHGAERAARKPFCSVINDRRAARSGKSWFQDSAAVLVNIWLVRKSNPIAQANSSRRC